MNIDDILEMLDDLLDKAPTVPFSGKKVVVESDKIRDMINEIRLNLPQEIKHAKLIVQDRQNIISDANKEAESIVRRSEERAKAIISNDEIVKQSKQRGTEILNQSQSKAKEIRSATNEYIDNILNQTEELLTTSLVDLKKTRQAIRMTSKNPSQNN
ncbi:MAG TPA: ATPase [Oscillospiraceae bacterium]|nr:ATPase [Oscillospiraceae bacterium]